MTTSNAVPPPRTPPTPAPSPAPPPKPKAKRWKKILLIAGGSLFGLLLLVLLIGPSIIASVARSKIPAVVAEQTGATATVGDVSFSWSGHVVLDEFRLVPKNFSDPLLALKRVDVKVDVGAALGGRYIAAVEVVGPKVLVEKGADGKFNYEFPPKPAPAPREPSEPKEKAPKEKKTPFVQATLKVRDGEVVVRGKGRETVYQNLSVSATVDTLEKPVAYDLSLESPLKDALKIKGAVDLDTISGPATLTLERISLKNLTGAARAYSDVLELDGTVSGSFAYELKGAPRFVGKGSLRVDGFSAVIHDPVLKVDRTVRLDTLSLSHDGGIDDKGNGRHVVTVSSGKALGATVTADVADAFGARLVKTDLKVDADLAALADVLAKAGALPKGMAMAGTVTVRGTCDSKGPTQADLDVKKLRVAAKVDVEVAGSGLDLVKDGKPMKLDGFKLRHVGTLDEDGTGKNTLTLSLGKALGAVVQVDVADAMGKAPLVKATLKGDSDLAELGKTVEKMIGLKPDMALEGAAGIQGTVEAKGSDSVKADLSVSMTNVVAVDVKEKKRHEIDPSIAVRFAGGWDGRTKSAVADVIRLDSSFATVNGKGGASLAGENPEIRETAVTVDADLEKLAGKLRSFVEQPPALGGKVTIRASVQGEKMGLSGELKGLRFEKYGPVDAVLKHDGTLDAKGNGKHTLTLESGKALVVTVAADVQDAYKDGRATSVRAAVKSDLAALSALLPGVIALKTGTSLAGTLALTAKAETKGSTWATYDVALDADNLSAVEKGKSQEIDKAIRLRSDGAWDGAKQMVVLGHFSLSSGFATAEAKGGASLAEPVRVHQSSLTLDADLAKLGARLGLFMADAPGLAGTATATGSYSGDRYGLDVVIKGVKIVQKDKTIGPIDATIAQRGTFSTAKGGAFRIETGTLASSAVDLKLSGEIRNVMEDGREGELKLDAAARPVELGKWMPGLRLGGPEIRLATTVSLKPNLVAVSGQTKVDGLTVTAKDEKGVDVVKTAKTGPVDFTLTMKGKDLLATLKTPSLEWTDKGYAAKAGLESTVTCTDTGTSGTTKLTNLEIADDKKNVVRDPGLTIVHDIGLADQNKSIDLRKVEVSSSFLHGTVTGRLLQLDRAPEFQKLHAAFKYIPDKMTAIARPWLPGRLEGAEEKALDFSLDGKSSSADLLAVLRSVRGAVDVDLAKFALDANGLTVSGRTRLELKDGKLTSGTPLLLNKGKTDLEATLDFNPVERNPRSAVTFHAKDVDANGRMGPLLEHVNPIFHTSGVDAKVDGVIQSDFNLAWTGPIDPDEKDWVATASKALSGTGVFGVQNLNVVGSPTLGEIMSVLGLGNGFQGELVATQIRVGGGQCSYENMTLRGSRKSPESLQRDQQALAQERQELEADKPEMTPKEYQKRQEELKLKEEDLPYRYVLRFTGVVGFDKQMRLRVLLPLTEGMQSAHPNLRKYIGSSFWVDLTGTTDKPRLDVKKMMAELAQRAAEGALKEKLGGALSGLLGNRKKEKEADGLYGDAQKAEAAKNTAEALQGYQRLLNDYGDTDFVRKHKASIQDRVKALGGK